VAGNTAPRRIDTRPGTDDAVLDIGLPSAADLGEMTALSMGLRPPPKRLICATGQRPTG